MDISSNAKDTGGEGKEQLEMACHLDGMVLSLSEHLQPGVPTLQLFICKKCLVSCMIFAPLLKCSPLCIGLSRGIPIKLIHVCGCNVTKCGKVQGGRILLQATAYQMILIT